MESSVLIFSRPSTANVLPVSPDAAAVLLIVKPPLPLVTSIDFISSAFPLYIAFSSVSEFTDDSSELSFFGSVSFMAAIPPPSSASTATPAISPLTPLLIDFVSLRIL